MYSVLLFVLFLKVVSSAPNKTTSSTSSKSVFEEDKWIWNVDNPITNRVLPETTNIQLGITPSPITKDDPCSPFNSTKNFSAPGRRISEVKCLEYIWEIEVKTIRARRHFECELSKASDTEVLNGPEVVGGRDTLPGEFLHMGAIGWKGVNREWEFKCGGSLISPNYILTAAHCTTASSGDTSLQDPTPKIVRLNFKNIFFDLDQIRSKKYDVGIKRIIIHPEYSSPKKYHDIAVMELEQPVVYNQYVYPSCLWSKPDFTELGTTATVTGWGTLKQGDLDISPELQAGNVSLIDTDKCNELLESYCNRNWCGVEEHQICAGKLAGGVDSCQGDSGGPLQVKIPLNVSSSDSIYNIIGVTSFGIGCAQPNQPGVYTRVSSFIDWIESIVWP